MAITRYAGDRFTIADGETKPTGVLDGAYLIDTGNLTQFVRRTVGGSSQWTSIAGGGGGGSPGGSNTQVQFNDNGVFGGTTGLTFDGQRLYANNFQLSGILYDSNASVGEGGMVLANEGTTGVHWKSIESVLSGVGGSGVANYVARWSDEDTLTTGALVDDGTKIGIGTASPAEILEVVSDSDPTILIRPVTVDSANSGKISYRENAGGTTGVDLRYDGNVNKFIIDTSDVTNALVIKRTDGRVGIGTNTPNELLEIFSTGTNTDAKIRLSSSGNTTGGRGIEFFDGAYNRWRIATVGANGNFEIHRSTTGNSWEAVPAISINKADGNVGIGTTNPGKTLDVDGDIRIRGDSGTLSFYRDTSPSDIAYIKYLNGTSRLDIAANNKAIVFMNENGPAESMRITSAGSVGIGTNAPAMDLHVVGTAETNVHYEQYSNFALENAESRMQIIADDGGTAGGLLCFSLAPAAGNNKHWIIHHAGPTASNNLEFGYMTSAATDFDANGMVPDMVIKTDGNVGIGNNLVDPQHRLHVSGDAIISGVLYDSTNSSGVSGHVLTSEVGGPQWKMIEDVLSGVGGNGTANYVPKWEDSDTIGNSIIYESGSAIGIGTDTPSGKFNVRGDSVWMGNASTDASSRLMFAENAAGSQGFSLLYAGATDPTIDGTAFTAAANSFNIYRHDNSIPGISAITIKRANGKVGIGTGGPVQQLHVVGDAMRFERTDNAVALQLYNNNASPADDAALGYVQFMGKDNDGTASIVHSEVRGGVQSNSNTAVNGYLAFLTTNNGTAVTEWMRIKSDGNVGIGTDTPGAKLQVNGDAIITKSSGATKLRLFSGGDDPYISFGDNTTNWAIGVDQTDSSFKISNTSGVPGTNDWFTITTAGAASFVDSLTVPGLTKINPRAAWGSYGRLMVGDDANTARPQLALVSTVTTAAANTKAELQFLIPVTVGSASASGLSRVIGAKENSSGGNVAGYLSFETRPAGGSMTERVRIASDGNVGIGDNLIAPEHRLHVSGDAIISGVLYDSTNSSGVSGHVLTSEAGGPQWKMIEDVLSGVGGNGTANYVPKWEDSDTIGNSIIYDNGSNIGIGNALPSGTLDIVGSNGTVDVAADGDAQELVIRNNDRAGIQILSSQTDMSSVVFGSAADANGANISYGPTSKLLTIGSQIAGGQVVFRAANGVEAVRIDAAGEVGIGTNAPGSVLHLNHLSEHTRLRMQTIATKAALIDFYSASTARWSWGVDNNQAYAKFENRTTANDAIRLVDSDDSVLLVPEAGNVGVGTTNPTSLLEASGVIRSTHATTVTAGVGIEMLYNTGTEIGYLYSYDRDAPAGYKTTRIGTDAYFNVSGNLGVGVEEPVYKFHVDGDAIISGVLYDQTNSTGDKGYVLTSDDNGPLWKASGDFDGLSADLIATGQTLTTDINAVASNLVLTGAFVDTNTAGVATNVANLIATGAFVDTNTLGIATNVTNISTNASNLIATGAFVDTNTAGVATNVTNIATNASNLIATGAFVDTNTLGIATNVTNISTNASNLILTGAFVDTNTAGVATNVTNISTNASNLILTGAIVDDVSGNLITTGQFLTNALPVGADPSAVISGAATNGSATTFMRSDAAPALKDTEVTAGAYTYTAITVDAQGRLTAASNGVAPGGGTVTGTGTNTYIPRWNGTTALHDSSISDSGSSVYMSRSSGLTPLVLLSNPANQVADIGGELIFQATYRATSGGQSTPVARIKGARENATTNNWAGRLTFHTSPGGDSPSASTEQMRIQSDGKVGIGHVTPSSKLTIDDPSAQTAINLASCAVMIRAATAAAQYSNIGFNYAGGVHEPQCTIGIQQKQWAAYTYADLVFATRSVTTNTAPTERMRIQHDGNVGIGIVAPAQLLHLQKAGGAKLRIQETGAEAWDLYAAGSLFGILQDGTYRLVIKDTGNVGIGTDAPEANLVVAGGGGHEAIFRTNEATAAQRAGGGFSSLGHSNSVSRYARMFLDADGANFSGTDYFTIEKFGNGGEVRLINYGNAYMTFWVNTSTEALVIKNDGNVGIGDAAPGSKVHIKDDAPVTSGALRYSLGITDNDTVAIGRGGGIDFLARYSDTGPTYSGYAGIQGYRENATNNNSAGALILLSRPAGGDLTERIRVQSDGNVGIGTVTSAYKLRVEGDSIATGDTYIYNNKALNILDSGGQRSLMITNYSSGSNSPYFSADPDQQAANTMMYWWIDASEKMSLDSGGNLSIQGTLTEASSIAIKENIETYSPSLENISKMRPVRFNKKKSKKKEVGLVAEELAEMFPELVETDEKGNAVGVNYSRAVAVLLHGFKELYKEVKELKEKI